MSESTVQSNEISLPTKIKKTWLFWKNELTGTLFTSTRVAGGTGRGETVEKQ